MNSLSNTTIFDSTLGGSTIMITPSTLNVSPIALNLNPGFLHIGNKRYTIPELEQRLTLLDRMLRDYYPEEFV